ncbi:hypothetical protein PVAND_004408 [Polypedilum vanderplanki]|uniref:Uncharacterized protein n=1 Tax=Polypedilum vanderplanki TaxID=319348 RepID=A0A9J6BY20_POLVA|nr:hypothetical protein PVAND_004408 [Polypedilum vanderplanki]
MSDFEDISRSSNDADNNAKTLNNEESLVVKESVHENSEESKIETEAPRASSTFQLCKKFKRIKYEIDMQNYRINKLQRELKSKRIPEYKAKEMEQVLKKEMFKLGEMIQTAMDEKRKNKEEDCLWGPISLDNDHNILLNPPKTPSDLSKISGFDEYAYTEILLSDNEKLETDRYKLQECILQQEETNCCLQKQIALLEQQMEKLVKGNQKVAYKMMGGDKTVDYDKLKKELKHYTNVADTLSNNINRMENYLKGLRNELNDLKCVKSNSIIKQDFAQTSTSDQTNACDAKIKELQERYCSLLNEYCQKETEHSKTVDRLKKCFKDKDNSGHEQIETEFLRKESEKLISEIEDYKIMMNELQSQTDLYREKFLKAQEKVEKQKIQLKKLENSNLKIEQQVNEEIKKIKLKFEEKLAELCPFPQKYEESQKELEEAISKIQELEEKLRETSSALTKAKCELKELKERPVKSNKEKYEKLQEEVERLKRNENSLKKTKECLEEKLCSLKSELDVLRKDSAKIITTTKFCAEKNRKILHDQINCLEMELAQCRANSSLSLTEKEEKINDLKNELKLLCNNFNDCQDQIKQLKEQIINITEKPKTEKFSRDLENWMGNLPSKIRSNIPIINLAIPGSHDSCAYAVTKRSKIAPDAEKIVKRLYRFIPCIVRRWAKTQKYSLYEQLENGIRYFDLRVAYNSKDDRIYFTHGVYCEEIIYPFEELFNFLSKHPKEFVILDFQHFYQFSHQHHEQLTNCLLKNFSTMIYERYLHLDDFSSLTLSKALYLHKQIIIIYRHHSYIDKIFFPSYYFVNPWPQTTKVALLERFLDDRLQLRSSQQGYCSQFVLTPTTPFILRRFYSTLKASCAEKVEMNCKAYIEAQKPGVFNDDENPTSNVFLADFVDLNDNDFVKTVVDLNMKLLK